eukprot:275934-Pelagomonas_calceolata.AAC.3
MALCAMAAQWCCVVPSSPCPRFYRAVIARAFFDKDLLQVVCIGRVCRRDARWGFLSLNAQMLLGCICTSA